jgi:hypothetical protein
LRDPANIRRDRAEWIEALLDAKPPHAERSWLATLRSLSQFAIKRGWLRADPTTNIWPRLIGEDEARLKS